MKVVAVIFLIALAGCTSRDNPVSVTYALSGANPNVDLAAAVLRDPGMQSPEVERGQRIVMGTASCEMGHQCFSCYQCHGIRGEGGATAALPRLAGQDWRYLYRALEEFASGRRANATMHEVSVALTDEQMQDVAAYYAKVSAPAPLAPPSKDDASAQAGLAIDQHGLADAGVPACATCHATAPRTDGPIYPYVAGQFADYLEQQLEQFRAGTRGGQDAQIMQGIARNLSAEQARAASVHFASQSPPASTTRHPQG